MLTIYTCIYVCIFIFWWAFSEEMDCTGGREYDNGKKERKIWELKRERGIVWVEGESGMLWGVWLSGTVVFVKKLWERALDLRDKERDAIGRMLCWLFGVSTRHTLPILTQSFKQSNLKRFLLVFLLLFSSFKSYFLPFPFQTTDLPGTYLHQVDHHIIRKASTLRSNKQRPFSAYNQHCTLHIICKCS